MIKSQLSNKMPCRSVAVSNPVISPNNDFVLLGEEARHQACNGRAMMGKECVGHKIRIYVCPKGVKSVGDNKFRRARSLREGFSQKFTDYDSSSVDVENVFWYFSSVGSWVVYTFTHCHRPTV